MPRYDYTCDTCNHEIEIIHSVGDCELTRKCPKCYNNLRRKFNAPHIEGSHVFPFHFWNCRGYDRKKYPKGLLINNKSEFKAHLRKRGLDSPYLHTGG